MDARLPVFDTCDHPDGFCVGTMSEEGRMRGPCACPRPVGFYVGTRCGEGRMRGPCACPRPVGLSANSRFVYPAESLPQQDKHKAPSLHCTTPCPYSNRSAISCAKCNTRIGRPLASTPPRRCIRQPGLSATRTVAPVLPTLFSLLFIRRSATSPCSIEVAPPNPQHTSDCGISRSSKPSASWMICRASDRRPRQLIDWQES